jgi:hypothetical protein
LVAQDVSDTLKDLDSSYTLQEQLQILLDSLFRELIKNREFVQETFPKVFLNPFYMVNESSSFKLDIINLLETIFKNSDNRGSMPFPKLLPDITYEYIIGIIYFWIQDESEEFHETSQLIDLTLSLAQTILSSGILNKVTELASFIIKTQVIKFLRPGNLSISSLLKAKKAFKF